MMLKTKINMKVDVNVYKKVYKPRTQRLSRNEHVHLEGVHGIPHMGVNITTFPTSQPPSY